MRSYEFFGEQLPVPETEEEYEALPVGSVVSHRLGSTYAQFGQYVKGRDGMWYKHRDLVERARGCRTPSVLSRMVLTDSVALREEVWAMRRFAVNAGVLDDVYGSAPEAVG